MKLTKKYAARMGILPLAGLLGWAALAEDLNSSAILKKAVQAIAEVKVMDAAGAEVGKGTGILVGSDGLFIASRRLLIKGVTATVQWGAGQPLPVLGVLLDDVEHDLVLAKAEVTGIDSLVFSSSKTIGLGQPITVVGLSEKGEKAVLDAKITSAFALLPDQERWIQLSLPIPANLRGAAVFSTEGELVGVAVSSVQKEDILPRSYLIPSEILIAQLKTLAITALPKPLGSLPKTTGNSLYLDPDYVDALSAASATDKENQLKSALIVVDHFPLSASAYRLLGLAYKAKGMTQEATDAFRKAVKISPEEASIWCDLAEELELGNNTNGAVATYQFTVKSLPNNATLWYNFACTLDKIKKTEDAVKAYEHVVQLNPAHTDAWFNLGLANSKLKKWNDSQHAFLQYTTLLPTDTQGLICLGIAYQNLDKNDDALKSYQQALAIKSDLFTPWVKLGEIYSAQNNLEEAMRCYQKIVKLDPNYSPAWLGLALAYGKTAKVDESIKAYQQFLKLKPDSLVAIHNMIPYLFSQARYSETISACQQATHLNARDVDAWLYQGQANQKLKQYDEAVKNYQQALAIREDLSEPWNFLGITYLSLRKNDDAIKAFQKAVEIEPNFGEAWSNLGLTYLRKYDRDKAKVALEKLQKIEPKLAEQLDAAIKKNGSE